MIYICFCTDFMYEMVSQSNTHDTERLRFMLSQFVDEVISKGAEALLPQNLEENWLERIYVAAKNFLDITVNSNGIIEEDEILNDMNSMMMLSSILEIAQQQASYSPSDKPYEIPEDMLFEYISCYSLSIVLEAITRESGMSMDLPTVETIFDRERLFAIEQSNPELTVLLNTLITGDDKA